MLRCSACNTLNPSDHTFCGYCGSRLSAPSGNDQPLPAWLGDNNDGPPNAQAQPADTALPPWLATPTDRTNITQPIATEQADKNAADQQVSTVQIQNTTQASSDNEFALPPWLSSPIESPTNDLPDWLHAEATDLSRIVDTTPSSTGAPPPTTAGGNALPDWLFDVDSASADVPVLPHLTPPATSMTSDPASNTPTASSDAAPPIAEESLDWLLNPQPAVEPATDTLPSWLRDDVPDSSSVSQSFAPINQSDLPSWLRDEVPTTPPQGSTVSVVDMQQDQFPPATAASDTSGSLPAWLRDDVPVPPSEQGRTTTPLQIDEPAAATNNGMVQRNDEQEQEAIPAWLRDDAGTAFGDTPAADEQTSAPASADQADLPAWLRDDANTATIETVPHIDSMALPLTESEPLASADLGVDTTTAETPSSPATTARVYDIADSVPAESVALVANDAPQPEPALASSVALVEEPVVAAQPAVYDAPGSQPVPPATEDDILAAITQPAAAAAPTTPVATPVTSVAVPAAPPSTPSPERAPSMSPPPRRQQANGLWIMLIIVLLVAILAVGWLALRFNNFL